MASPAVPARPVRSTQNLAAAHSSQLAAPKIPPRPDRQTHDRSISPSHRGFDRSPLHGSLFATPGSDNSSDEKKLRNASNNPHEHGYGRKQTYHSASRKDAPSLRRPPSVSAMPSVGQEGHEYASLEGEYAEATPKNHPGVPEQTSVKQDLPLHAPKASLSSATAKSRISVVTRTDSTQAAAIGIGRPPSTSQDEKMANSSQGNSRSGSAAANRRQSRGEGDYHDGQPLRSASSQDRPLSSQSQKDEYEEQGIPEIGLQVPMYPNAGDVQAPTPSPFHQPDATNPRSHTKRRSTREVFTGPPGSYGLHGHGVEPRDPFERAWYEKHPDELKRDGHGEYGPGIHGVRSEWALSSNDLNKLVHDKAHQSAGLGASDEAPLTGMPDEQIGYMASEEYAMRFTSPRPASAAVGKRGSMSAETPLRQSFVPDDDEKANDAKTLEANDQAVEDDLEDEVIHIDPTSRRMSRADEDYKQEGEGQEENVDQDVDDETVPDVYSAPILAADEVAKNPEAEYMQPAVPPEWERSQSAVYIDSDENNVLRRSNSRNNSRPNSRPTSFHAPTSGAANPMVRLMNNDEHEHSSTPLEEIHEYEPLFPSDEEEGNDAGVKDREKKMMKTAQRPKLDAHSHRFPSMDIWEDTPGSLQLQTVVATPQLPAEEEASAAKKSAAGVFESPEAEKARKANEGMTDADRTSFLPQKAKLMADPRFKPGVREEMDMQQQDRPGNSGSRRPGMHPRFPSRDVWEDSPDHSKLVTTVQNPQEREEIESATSTTAAGDRFTANPAIPPRPPRKDASSQMQDKEGLKDTSKERAQPALPDRPKPKLPTRPARLASKESSEQSPLSRTMSMGSEESNGSSTNNAAAAGAESGTNNGTSVAAVKTKPSLPPWPGNKIAALKAGFMSDLNSKLKMGPAAVMSRGRESPKSEDGEGVDGVEEKEKDPMKDVRKGRAKGPARRKPAAVAAAGATAGGLTASSGKKEEEVLLSISAASVVWRLDVHDDDGGYGKVIVPGLDYIKTADVTSSPPQDARAAAARAKDTTNDDTSGVNTPGTSTNTSSLARSIDLKSSKVQDADAPLMTSTAVQTGHVDINVPALGHGGSGRDDDDDDRGGNGNGNGNGDAGGGRGDGREKMTVYIGGAAPEEGNVVVKHGLDGTGDGDVERDGGGNVDSSGGGGGGDDGKGEVVGSVKKSDEVIIEDADGEERVVKRAGEDV